MSSSSRTFSVGDRRCSIARENVNGTVPFQSVGVAHHAVDRMMSRNLSTWKRCRFLSSTTKDDANSSSSGTALDSTANSLANEEWQKFQDSITFVEPAQSLKGKVDGGFVGKRKVRGGRIVRKQEGKKLLREQALNPSLAPKTVNDVKGGRFPTLRYSDEETQRLLDEAHANIPKRTGRRGTRNLKRQNARWEVIYADRRQRKSDNYGAHLRRMTERKRIAGEVREVKEDAKVVRGEEREYRMGVLRKWAEIQNMVAGGGVAGVEGEEVKEIS